MPTLIQKHMTSLITILISLLGYGTPEDFEHYTEDQLESQIEYVEGGGILNEWEE